MNQSWTNEAESIQNYSMITNSDTERDKQRRNGIDHKKKDEIIGGEDDNKDVDTCDKTGINSVNDSGTKRDSKTELKIRIKLSCFSFHAPMTGLDRTEIGRAHV